MSITVSNISKTYNDQKALDNVSFKVKSPEVVGFLGPNGAGKSTMMKILTTYISPSEGSAMVNEYDVNTNQKNVQRSVGYLPEHNPLYLDLYVREYLQFNANVYKVKSNRVEEVIELTGLSPESHKKIGQLSKGYRQRVGLANALLHDPEVLILDEPTTGLDPNQLMDIRSLITTIGQTKTVFLSTHIMQEVEAFATEVRAAGSEALAVFYFAGHGVRSDGFNYLLPLGLNIQSEADITGEAVSAEWVLDRIHTPQAVSVKATRLATMIARFCIATFLFKRLEPRLEAVTQTALQSATHAGVSPSRPRSRWSMPGPPGEGLAHPLRQRERRRN